MPTFAAKQHHRHVLIAGPRPDPDRSAGTAASAPRPRNGAAAILQLQRQIGNAAVRTMLGRGRTPDHTGAQTGIARRITAARGRGTPLESTARIRLERSYGTDLSSVRVHTDPEADRLARTINARAFASASDIFFASGHYAPSSGDGFKTLAHEVAHVVQQSRGPVPAAAVGGLRISTPSDRGEIMAERAAGDAVRGIQAAPWLDGPATAGPSRRHERTSRPRRGAAARGRRSRRKPRHTVSEGEPVALARMMAGSTEAPVTIQRAPQPLVPLGDFDLMFNPSSALDFTPPGATAPTSRRVNDTSSTATFSGIPRGSTGTVTLDVAMQWFRKASPPPGNCDVCEILRRALTFELSLPIPILGPLLPSITIEPAPFLIEQCRRLVRVDAEGIRPLLRQIREAAGDPCGALLRFLDAEALEPVCFLLGPLAAPFIEPFRREIFRAVTRVERALDECRRQTPGGAPSRTGPLAGNARAIMTTTFVSDPTGQLVFSGLTPAPSQAGEGARLLLPVDALRTPVPSGGTVQEQPTLVTTSGAAGTQGRLFTVNLAVDPVPADADYDCSDRFGPFKVGKAVFEDEDGQIRAIRDFFFGMHPKVRQDIEEGRGNLVITGRASKTDTQANNLVLGKKRADRVEGILRNFTGNSPRLRALSLGELGAQTVGCPDTPENPARGAVCEDPNERRADVNANGTIREAGNIDPKCTGHLGEATPTGASNPVTEAEGPGAVVSEAAIQPTLSRSSTGDAVVRLQQLLNDIANAGLSVDGDFGSRTQNAVMAFQSVRGLQPDGIVGPKTWAQLLSV